MKTVIVFNVTDEAEALLKVRKRYALIGFSRLEEGAWHFVFIGARKQKFNKNSTKWGLFLQRLQNSFRSFLKTGYYICQEKYTHRNIHWN